MSETRRIGQFELQELLGEGGIGQVFAGRDTVLDRPVAIKSLRRELLNDKSFVERFRIEAKNLAVLTHPNITTLYTLLEQDGSLYMVMELVRGRTLETILSERGAPFTLEEALAVIAQAADGLAYAHEMGIVHRDIKPANLILTPTGLLKIMDFGIARAQGSQRMTRDGSIVGTLAYMSPEQCRGQDVDGLTDLYSLGIVLYEMLTGKVPFEAASDYELMQAHINKPPEWPSRLVPGIPPHAERALMKALAKKPGDRFGSVTALKQALGAPASRTEAVSIVHKVTRLAGSSAETSLPAITAAVSTVAETVKKAQIPFALKGVAIGGAAALAMAAAVLFFLSPGPPPAPAPRASAPLPATKVSAPPAMPQAPVQPQNPYLIDTRRLGQTPGQNVQPADARPSQPPNNPGKPGPGNRPPFEVAAEAQARSPAAANQTGGVQAAVVPATGRSAVVEDAAQRRAPARPEPTASAPTPEPAPQRSAPERVEPTPDPPASAPTETSPPGPAAQPSAPTGPGSPASGGTAAGDPAAGDAAPDSQASNPPASGSTANGGAPARAVQTSSVSTEYRRPLEKDAIAAYEARSFARARELAEPCAREGNPECQFILGRILETGSAGSRDPGTAADWYRKAAEAGLAKARFNLGALYYAGEGLPRDPRLAAEWFSKAAHQNHAVAQFNLAYLYEKGDGVPRNLAEARRWYTEVVEKATDRELLEDAQDALDRLSGRRRRR
jgi:serine/threonine protein kinase/TPR repeat protein